MPAQCAPSPTLEFWFSRQCTTNATPRRYSLREPGRRPWAECNRGLYAAYSLRVPRFAVVTGSSSGIGQAIAARLAADGCWVLLADVRRDPLTGGVPTDEVIAVNLRGPFALCRAAFLASDDATYTAA
jgi:short chain dehydrogenase